MENIIEIGKKYGWIDVLVNNVGGFGGRFCFEDMIIEFYWFVMVLNFDFVFFVLRVVILFLK